ncbi:hypothetical protein Tco_0847042 [Tanacetum coccineum]
MDLTAAAKNHFMELNELLELRDRAYENTRIYKEKTKKWHDSRLRRDKDFKNGDNVLLFNSCLKLHPGKLKSKWSMLGLKDFLMLLEVTAAYIKVTAAKLMLLVYKLLLLVFRVNAASRKLQLLKDYNC